MWKPLLLFAWLALGNLAAATELGLNSFNLAQAYLGLASGGDGSERYRAVTRAMAERAIADADDAGARFLRVAVTGYEPSSADHRSDLELWLKQPDQYWAAIDAMVDEVGRHRMQLVMTLFWNIRQFPAMAHQTVRDMIVDPESESYRLAARYIGQLVARYKGRREILFYEVSNELNLEADIDNATRCRGSAKSPDACSAAGNFTTDEMIAFGRRVQQLIRAIDAEARIGSGYSAPRRAAEHLRARPEWTTGHADFRLDTPEQFEKYLEDVHAGYDIVSVHIYPTPENARFGKNDPRSLDAFDLAMKVARRTGKKIYFGEFGDPDGQSESPQSFTARMLQHIGATRPDYASPWAWEFYQFSTFHTRDTAASRSSLGPGLTDATIGRFRALSRTLGRPPAAPGDSARTPRIVMVWPLRCTLIRGPDTVAALVSADPGVQAVQLYVDDRLLAQRNAPPYTTAIDPHQISPGAHMLRAVVVDLQGRRAERTVPVLFGDSAQSSDCPNVFPQRNR